jgi:PucR family transcriptional regulator, purine catabolism regulatory protein
MHRSEGMADGNGGAGIPLSDLLGWPEFAQARLLTSPHTADGRYVSSASVRVDVGGDELFRRDELVMTTGIGLASDEAMRELVRAAVDASIACLAIATGRHIQRVPASAVKAAEQLRLPIVELPPTARFSEITELVVREILSRQFEVLRKSEQVHGLLTGIVLSRGRLPEVCEALAHLLGREVTVIDRWGERRATSVDLAARPSATPDIAFEFPIATSTFELGTLGLGGDPDVSLTPLDRRTAQHGATAAALVMMTEVAVAEAAARTEHEFLAGLLSGLFRSSEEIGRRAEALGLDPHGRFWGVCLLFEEAPGGPISDADVAEMARWAVERTVASRRLKVLRSWHGLEAMLLLPASPIPIRQQVANIVDAISALLGRHSPHLAITAGISTDAAVLTQVAAGMQEAVTASRLVRSLGWVGRLAKYEDLEAYPALLEACAGRDSAHAFRALQDRYLAPILEYEHRACLPLMDTLTALFENNGNVSATARHLRLNRQSLLYRIAKIESLLSVELSSPSSRLAIELAVQAHRLRSFMSPGEAAGTFDQGVEGGSALRQSGEKR